MSLGRSFVVTDCRSKLKWTMDHLVMASRQLIIKALIVLLMSLENNSAITIITITSANMATHQRQLWRKYNIWPVADYRLANLNLGYY